jgi:uncharacterized membrane protein YkoI
MMKKRILLPLFLVLILTLTACGDGDLNGDDVDNNDEVRYEDIELTPEDAYDKFMEAHSDSKIREISLDKNMTEYQYVVEGYDDENDYEVKINPVSGDIISDDTEIIDLDDEQGEITKDQLSKIESLVEKALEESKEGSKVNEWSLEYDDNILAFDIEVIEDNNEVEYTYDLETENLIEKDN